MKSTSVHNPAHSVPLREGSVIITELSWPDAMNVYQKLMAQSKSFMDETGALKLDAAAVITAISENVILGQWLVLKSTGKDEAWLLERSLSEVLDIATEAAVLNIGIIMSRIKNVGSRLREAVAGANPPTPTPKTEAKPSASIANSPT
jgi:hypothetical protein